jgi:hypothetical protein
MLSRLYPLPEKKPCNPRSDPGFIGHQHRQHMKLFFHLFLPQPFHICSDFTLHLRSAQGKTFLSCAIYPQTCGDDNRISADFLRD